MPFFNASTHGIRARTLLVCCLVSAGMVVTTALAAQTPIARGWPLDADGAVKMFNDAGSIRVIGWDRDSVHVTGTVAAGASFFGGGAHTGIKFGVEATNTKKVPVSDLVVRVPMRARLSIRSAMADVEVSAVSGPVDVSSVGGQLRVQGSPSEVRAETINGHLDVTASPPYLRLKTATGNVTWTGSSDDVTIITVSGRVVVNVGTVQRGRFEALDGEIRFTGGVARAGHVLFDTHSGDIVLALRKDTRATLEVTAPVSNLLGIHNDVKIRGSKTPGTITKNVGAPLATAPTLTLRSFKGSVKVTLQ